MEQGYIGIFRKFFNEHEFWQEKRKYSKAEAWIDLLRMARWKDEPEKMLDKRGAYILGFGDIYISERFLGTRWLWSTKKVRNFLSYLLEMESITFKKRSSHRTIININNLGTYIGWIKGERSSEEAVKKQSGSSEEAKKKKVKKEKKDNMVETPEKFIPSQTLIDWSTKESYWKNNLLSLAESCLDHFRSKGEKRADWEATIRNWCKKDKEYHPDKYRANDGGYKKL